LMRDIQSPGYISHAQALHTLLGNDLPCGLNAGFFEFQIVDGFGHVQFFDYRGKRWVIDPMIALMILTRSARGAVDNANAMHLASHPG
jgi:hypothetical protein